MKRKFSIANSNTLVHLRCELEHFRFNKGALMFIVIVTFFVCWIMFNIKNINNKKSARLFKPELF